MALRALCLALAAQLLLVNCYDLAEVQFSTAGVQGDDYRRLIEPMPQFTIEAATCASSQVSISISYTLKSGG